MDTAKKVLLVEDDGTLRRLYTDFLERAGFEVDPAVEGKEGYTKATNGGYSLILLDLLLPGMRGDLILTRLKENPPLQPNGPIIVLTNQDEPDVHARCQALGASGVIIKSAVTPEQFTQIVRDVVQSQNTPNQNAKATDR